MTETPERSSGRDWVAIILAVGLVLAVNFITFAVLYDAIFSNDSGLSENATQILTAAFGGLTGILGGYIGYRAGSAEKARTDEAVAELRQIGDSQNGRGDTNGAGLDESPSH